MCARAVGSNAIEIRAVRFVVAWWRTNGVHVGLHVRMHGVLKSGGGGGLVGWWVQRWWFGLRWHPYGFLLC